MSDLPAQLRELHTHFGQAHDVLLEAAAEIERLEAYLEELQPRPVRDWDLP